MIATLLEPKHETRVAITPYTAKNYINAGFKVVVEHNAGLAAGFSNQAYEEVGVQINKHRKQILEQSTILLCVNEPNPQEVKQLKANTLMIAPIDNDPQSELIKICLEKKINLFSMNLIPRISRAQSMDSLSSQANLAGYRAVLEACAHYHRVIPMMMTAAGMIQPAKVLVLGAGVAGLQAIATAKRLGAVVYAFDVRRAAKEQVESLGAKFVEVNEEQDSETQGGYASETSDEYKKLQAELIDHYAAMVDIIISTALIPGQKAPLLLKKHTIEGMKEGSVIVDLATARGGNCELSVVEKVINHNGVSIIGFSNLAGLVPTTASELYANNVAQLINLLANSSTEIQFNPLDEIVQKALLCHQGNYLAFQTIKETHHA